MNQSFTTDNLSSLQTFTFNSGFTNLSQVQWAQNFPFHQFDNINVSPAVPVPLETDALPIVGSTIFFGLGIWGKRKRDQQKILKS